MLKSPQGVSLQCGGLRIWCCHCSGSGCCCGVSVSGSELPGLSAGAEYIAEFIAYYFVAAFYVHVPGVYCSIVFLLMALCYFYCKNNSVLIKSVGKCSLLFYFLEEILQNLEFLIPMCLYVYYLKYLFFNFSFQLCQILPHVF